MLATSVGRNYGEVKFSGRRKTVAFLATLGICMVGATLALNVGWILLNVKQVALLITGGILYLTIAAGLMVYTILLVREIRLNDAQENFLNAITHELKTPVASLRLFTDTLRHRDKSLNDSTREKIFETMRSETDRLTQTIDQLLKAAQAGRDTKEALQNQSQKIELSGLIKKCIQETRTRFQLPEEAIQFSMNDLATTQGNPDELATAVKNLLENAVQYSPKGRVRIEVTLYETPKACTIDVQDNGIGISEKDRKSVFKKFYRAQDNSLSHQVKGTGLGLSIVESIVKAHKGRVSVPFSKPGEGSLFRIELRRSENTTSSTTPEDIRL